MVSEMKIPVSFHRTVLETRLRLRHSSHALQRASTV